ncbi:hypothetical protein C8R43DRAFT_1020086 [Mycena crocata]|nr:hypothetical protein C8R43DRAFT_1020086 [Mycena crocata]
MNDIRELVRSQRPLTHGQLASLRGSLEEKMAQADDEINKRMAEIAKRQVELEELVARRAELQDQHNVCVSLDAPIRRLPSELLVEVFALHLAALCMQLDDHVKPCDASAFERLAQKSLLELSRVCARWHAIALDTPSLWTNVFLSTTLWANPATTNKALELLQSALDRGGHHALTVCITDYDGEMPESALALIVSHSARWTKATFSCPLPQLQRLVGASLPRLETLKISRTPVLVPGAEILFAAAPRLKNLLIAGSVPPRVFRRGFGRPSTLAYEAVSSAVAIVNVISSMPRMLQIQKFRFQFRLDAWIGSPNKVVLAIPPTSSDISELEIELMERFHQRHCQQALAAIFRSLTLPHLHTFALHSCKYRRYPLLWSQRRFMAFATRSSFHLHLRMFSVSDLGLAEPQLLECLTFLAALEHLEISDHAIFDGRGADIVLITDSLLRALTERNDASDDTDARTRIGFALAPRLTRLRIRSRLQFSDAAYLAFVCARRPFTSQISVMPEAERDWRPLHTQLRAQEGVVSIVWAP